MKFVLAGYFGFGNFGDEAILKYAIDILRYYYKDADLTVITQDVLFAQEKLNVNGIYRFNLKNILSTIKNADYLIFPGGSILQDTTSLKSIIYYLGLIFLATIFNTKILMLSQGIGPIHNKFAQNITFKLLKKVNLITLRDEKSYKMLVNNGINTELTADLIWAFTQKLKSNDTQENNSIFYGEIPQVVEKKKIGLQLRSWATLTDEKLEIIAKNILKAFHYLEFDYKLICLQKGSDREVLIKLGQILFKLQPKAQIELIEETEIEKNVEVLQSMDYMIAMRFHAGLCTINAEKSLLMLSYDPKTEEFCKELGLKYIDINALNSDNFKEGLKWIKDFNPARTALKTNIFVKKSQQNVDFLVKEIG